ncbi:MAG: extracellular solute-binding protein [Firmicutes bacterium]|nr:extracellular solute-binding protein [Bacillota bacterium]
MNNGKNKGKCVLGDAVCGIARLAFIIMLSLSLLIFLTACSGFQINLDNIFPAETLSDAAEAGSETETESDTAAPDTSAETFRIYEYTGLSDATEYLEGLGEYSFDGESLFIKCTSEDAKNLIFVTATDDGDGSDSYSEALYERTLMVEEKLSCKLYYSVLAAEEMETELASAIAGEDYYANLLMLEQDELEVFAVAGYLSNLYSLPFFDVEDDFILTDATLQLSAAYSLYGVVSYATVDPDEIPCVFVNSKLFSKYSEKTAESLVKSGTWTWDKMLSVGSITWRVGTTDDVADLITSSFGLHFVSNEEKTVPTVCLPTGASEAADMIYTVTKSYADSLASIDPFLSEDAVFYVGKLGDMNALALTGIEWTVVPIPKGSESQSGYFSLISDGAVLAAPANITDYTGTSYLIRALAAASYGYLRDSYVQYHMYSTVRSESSLDMIEIIYDSVFYDFSFSLGYDSLSIDSATYGLMRDNIYDGEESDFDIEALFERRRDDADYILAERYPLP